MHELNKKFLIFTGVGDNENQFFSWAKNFSDVFDRALNYYGEDKKRLNEISKCNSEFIFHSKGMIWENFVKNYELFKYYDYVLIVDSDLELDPKQLEETFKMAEKNNWPACQWSRDVESYGVFVKHCIQNKNSVYRKTNYIEMLFMMIRRDLLKKLIDEWLTLDLKWSTGVCLVLSNIALHNKLLPFYLIDKFKFYNPHPHEKINGREIDYTLDVSGTERLHDLLKIMSNDPNKYRITINNIQVVS